MRHRFVWPAVGSFYTVNEELSCNYFARATMPTTTEIRSVAFVGDYLPRICGIATFTSDLRQSFAAQRPATDCLVVPVSDLPSGYDYPPEVRFEIQEQELESYSRAADFLNFANIDI